MIYAICSILGPLLAMVGAGLLAYDVLSGPRRWFGYYFYHKGHIEAIERMRKSVSDDAVDRPTARQAEIHYSDLVKDADGMYAKNELDKRNKALSAGIRGLILIGVGSFLQSIGAVPILLTAFHSYFHK